MMNRHMTFALVALALAGFGCGDDDGDTTTTDDMGTADVDMGIDTDMGSADVDMGSADVDMGPTSDREPAEALADARAIQDELDRLSCTCDMGDFESVDECVSFGARPPEYYTCEDAAYADNLAEAGPAQVCFTDALEVYAECVEAAACDSAAIETCFDGVIAAVGECPEGSEAFDTAVDACVASTITGDPAEACPDEESVMVGDEVLSGTTVLAGDDFVLECNGGGAPDIVLNWTAPTSGTYVIDTVGSTYDTALAVFTACDGTELLCNDDGDDIGLLSQVTLEATATTVYTIVIDGYDEVSAGDFVLNINPVLAP